MISGRDGGPLGFPILPLGALAFPLFLLIDLMLTILAAVRASHGQLPSPFVSCEASIGEPSFFANVTLFCLP
ncbi:MAG: hypothetical protein ACRD1R_20380 [Acidobacteriota bacterium]